MSVRKHLELAILPQPDNLTCGPTCLHAVYGYYGDAIPLETVIQEVTRVAGGGTLGVLLAQHALQRGYDTTLYSFNLGVLDPSWFAGRPVDLEKKLAQRAAAVRDPRVRDAALAYRDYVAMGGRLELRDLTASLIRHYLRQDHPILTGLSATYLYQSPREKGETVTFFDDVHGEPQGHFVVLHGYDARRSEVTVADPFGPDVEWERRVVTSPHAHYYQAHIARIVCAILLGVLTYDGNLLIIEPREEHRPPKPKVKRRGRGRGRRP